MSHFTPFIYIFLKNHSESYSEILKSVFNWNYLHMLQMKLSLPHSIFCIYFDLLCWVLFKRSWLIRISSFILFLIALNITNCLAINRILIFSPKRVIFFLLKTPFCNLSPPLYFTIKIFWSINYNSDFSMGPNTKNVNGISWPISAVTFFFSFKKKIIHHSSIFIKYKAFSHNNGMLSMVQLNSVHFFNSIEHFIHFRWNQVKVTMMPSPRLFTTFIWLTVRNRTTPIACERRISTITYLPIGCCLLSVVEDSHWMMVR